MERLLAIFWDWRFAVMVLLAMALFAVFEWGKVKEYALQGSLMAKKLAKEMVLRSGQEQEDWVVAKVYPCLPAQIRIFISEQMFRNTVRYLYKTAKDLLDDGELNGTCGEEAPSDG